MLGVDRYPFSRSPVPPFPESILKPCDIRGLTPDPLGLDQSFQVGRAVGTYLRGQGQGDRKVVIGGDIRESSPALLSRLSAGLQASGMKVIEAGIVSTPLLAYAVRHAEAAAGVMVTASHNPPAYNGFKFFLEDGTAPIEWVHGLYDVIRCGEFQEGVGTRETRDFLPDYREALVASLSGSFRGFSLVVDIGNGATALTAPSVLEALGCEVTWMNERVDPQFKGRGADSSHLPALAPLGVRVREKGAALGAAFDGDGDRITFVDDQGHPLPNDDALGLIARHYLRRQPGGKIVYDGKSSGHLERVVSEAGGIPLLERTGHVFIHTRMRKEGALLAGEASGHFFLPGMFPGDALFTLLAFIEVLQGLGMPLSKAREAFPPRVSSNDLKVHFEMDRLPALVGKLARRARALGANVSELDGVRAVFPEGWGIVRASVTEPVLSCRFEAQSLAHLREMVASWFQDVPEMRDDLLGRISPE